MDKIELNVLSDSLTQTGFLIDLMGFKMFQLCQSE